MGHQASGVLTGHICSGSLPHGPTPEPEFADAAICLTSIVVSREGMPAEDVGGYPGNVLNPARQL